MARYTWARRQAWRPSGYSPARYAGLAATTLLSQVLQQHVIERRGALHLRNVAAVVQHHRLGSRDVFRQRLGGGQGNEHVIAAPDDQGRGFDRAQFAVHYIFAAQNGVDEAVDGIAVVLAYVLGKYLLGYCVGGER